MKRIAWALALLFCTAIFLFAGDKNNANEMTGWICNTKCVDHSSTTATCNQNCSETSGKVVFISDDGRILQIANQDKAQPMAGKHCKMTAKKNPTTGALDVQNMVELRGP
jgi:hypothetical protein